MKEMKFGTGDFIISVFVVAVIFMMILPIPTEVVDVLIGINMAVAVILLMLSMFIASPLELVAFPSILLLTTLFRLSLSVTTTRLILLDADAGEIIETFGNFVVGGNMIVGVIIFLIITIVQFLVVTKGAERVAEVGARFSLDGMPGKQMSIDSDMRAGLINMEEARKRRQTLEKESQLFGSMDGAMKFVKGDAIAGIIIIIVNIIGGISVGTLQHDLTSGEAAEIYAILTIGDGLVSQIPALIISITAGIIVTRVSSDEDDKVALGTDIVKQVVNKPAALFIASFLLVCFGSIPGFPTITFYTLAFIVLTFALFISKNSQNKQGGGDFNLLKSSMGSNKDNTASTTDEDLSSLTVPIILEIENEVEDFLEFNKLNEAIKKIRHTLYMDLGISFPPIHLRNTTLPNTNANYRILIDETPISEGRLLPDSFIVINQHEPLKIANCNPVINENFSKSFDVFFVKNKYKERLQSLLINILEPDEFISFHVQLILKKYAKEFIGLQETKNVLNTVESDHAELIAEVQRLLPLGKLSDIFQRLVSEEISLRNMKRVLETLVEWAQKEKDSVLLTEYVRCALNRYISYKHSNGNNVLPAYLLDEQVENLFRNNIRQTSTGSFLTLDANDNKRIITSVKEVVGDPKLLARPLIIITSLDIRRYVKVLITSEYENLAVLSFQEISKDISIQPLGRITLLEKSDNISELFGNK